jgi:sarcosine oxidase, subunit beta
MSSKQNVVVIGAGVIGCAIALQLCRKGYATLNVDKNPAAGYGSTSSSCAIVRFSYSTIDSVKLAYEGYHYWKSWPEFLGVEDESGFARFVECGHLVLKTHKDDRAETSRIYDALGIAYEEWDIAKVKVRMPSLDPRTYGPPVALDDPAFFNEPRDDLAGAIYLPQGGYVTDPQLAAHNLRRAVEAAGGKFLFNTEVTAVSNNGDRVDGVVLTDGMRLDAAIVVNAAGPHSFVINRMAGVEAGMRIRTRALRREVHHVPAPPGFDGERQALVVSDSDAGVYFRPETGNRISVGSTDPACDPKTWIDDPDEFYRGITDAQWKSQVYRLAKRIPELPIPNRAPGVADLYDVSDDWTPIYDKSALRGFYMAIGTSGHQFKNAGVAGTLMADLIEACEAGHDHDIDPLSFHGGYTGLDIALCAFSRLRGLNTKSSFSVRG